MLILLYFKPYLSAMRHHIANIGKRGARNKRDNCSAERKQGAKEKEAEERIRVWKRKIEGWNTAGDKWSRHLDCWIYAAPISMISGMMREGRQEVNLTRLLGEQQNIYYPEKNYLMILRYVNETPSEENAPERCTAGCAEMKDILSSETHRPLIIGSQNFRWRRRGQGQILARTS